MLLKVNNTSGLVDVSALPESIGPMELVRVLLSSANFSLSLEGKKSVFQAVVLLIFALNLFL